MILEQRSFEVSSFEVIPKTRRLSNSLEETIIYSLHLQWWHHNVVVVVVVFVLMLVRFDVINCCRTFLSSLIHPFISISVSLSLFLSLSLSLSLSHTHTHLSSWTHILSLPHTHTVSTHSLSDPFPPNTHSLSQTHTCMSSFVLDVFKASMLSIWPINLPTYLLIQQSSSSFGAKL